MYTLAANKIYMGSSRNHYGSTYEVRYGDRHVEPQCLRLGIIKYHFTKDTF